MAVALSVGTTVEVSASSPATYDAVGFGALSYTAVGEVESLGEFGGSAQITNFTPIGTGVVNKLKGSIDYGQMSMTIGRLTGDAGQDLLKAGFDGVARNTEHSFQLTLNGGAVLHFTGVISSFTTNAGDANTVTMVTCNVDLNNAVIVS